MAAKNKKQPSAPLFHRARVTFARSRRGHWWWTWEDTFLGHTTTETKGGFPCRADCVIAFCLTADARGYPELAGKIGQREWSNKDA